MRVEQLEEQVNRLEADNWELKQAMAKVENKNKMLSLENS